MFSARCQSTHTASAAHSRVLLLISEISKMFTPMEKLPWIEIVVLTNSIDVKLA